MSELKKLFVATIIAAGLCVSTAVAGDAMTVWSVDPHIKIFRDTKPPEKPGVIRLRAARNEYEPAQIALRAGAALKGVRVELSPLKHADGKTTIGGENFTWNFVGFIPIKKNTQHAEKIQIRAAPFEVPDPLLEDRTMDVAADSAQPIWLTVRVPKDAAPGLYRGEVAVIAGDVRKVLPVELTVDPFTLPDERHLLVTNWFNVSNIAKTHNVELYSEPFWAVLERYARNMADHRQNVVMVSWRWIWITREPDGNISFDYGRFDRFVELFEKAGVADRIEISHVGHPKDGWGSKEFVLRKVSATDCKTGKRVSLGPEEGMAPLLADLERHLDKRGWLEKSMIHIADEPLIHSAESWRKVSGFVHKAAPRLRRIEAIEASGGFEGALEVWVPQLGHFDRWREAYEARRGDCELWYYICWLPNGNFYPNRFLDIPLSRVRVLHWINFSEDLKGYLHWGLDKWNMSEGGPFGTPFERYSPGDTHVIYPGSNGPLNSIRWEIQRDSIEDFEYLHLLTAKTAELKKQLGEAARWVHPERRAKELSRRVVPAIANTEKDPAKIVATRREVAEEIMALDREPLLLVETEPSAGSTMFSGSIRVDVRGATVPGAVVKVNGKAVEVRDDGTFVCYTWPNVRVEVEHDGKKKTTVRRFHVRN